jgi:hypothetical protein
MAVPSGSTCVYGSVASASLRGDRRGDPLPVDQSRLSAGGMQRLVEQIRRTCVKAIYPETSINPRLEQAVARESGATTGAPLCADTLGP